MIFSKEINSCCAYCKYGRLLHNNKTVLCSIKGIVDAAGKCKKYSYSPLKRIPPKKQNRQIV